MYVPEYFNIRDMDTIMDFVSENGFALLLTASGDDVLNTLIPIIAKRNDSHVTLTGHMARANPHWKTAEGKRSSILFLGPHHYISPRWYTIEKSVPTWNYSAVRMSGIFQTVSRAESKEIVMDLSKIYDPEWASLGKEKEQYYEKMVDKIVGFRLNVQDIMCKMKLSQNRPVADRLKVIENLKKEKSSDAQMVAAMMEHYSINK